MTEAEWRLLGLLSTGQSCSGEDLGRVLGVTRAAIWKMINGLRAHGFVIVSQPGRGYALRQGIDWLDVPALQSGMQSLGVQVQVFNELDSTNQELLRQMAAGCDGHAVVILAEQQTAGRGRRGRSWSSPLAYNFYATMGWRFDGPVSRLAGLSLAVGVGLAEAVEQVLGQPLGLKWPNDLLLGGCKLGGILIELTGDASGPCMAVVGVGVNHRGFPAGEAPDQPWACIQDHVLVSRTDLTLRLLTSMVSTLECFAGLGFQGVRERFMVRDVLKDQALTIEQSGATLSGWGRGVDDAGNLLIERQGLLHTVSGGEVSVRSASA